MIPVDCAFQNTKELYSGPFARDTACDVKQRSDPGQWRVFVLRKFNENMVLTPGMQVLHQVCMTGNFFYSGLHPLHFIN